MKVRNILLIIGALGAVVLAGAMLRYRQEHRTQGQESQPVDERPRWRRLGRRHPAQA